MGPAGRGLRGGLLSLESRRHRADPGAGPGGGALGHKGKLYRSGGDRHAHERTSLPGGYGGVEGRHSPYAHRLPEGGGKGGGVPLGKQLYHRADPGGERWVCDVSGPAHRPCRPAEMS